MVDAIINGYIITKHPVTVRLIPKNIEPPIKYPSFLVVLYFLNDSIVAAMYNNVIDKISAPGIFILNKDRIFDIINIKIDASSNILVLLFRFFVLSFTIFKIFLHIF